jgi:methylated-DNA-[protein]-cysteine S-methyltransferase
MSHVSFHSPLGDLTAFAEKGNLVALDWGRVESGAETDLLRETRRQLADYFAGRRKTFDLPLAPNGSVFQRKVWAAVCRIPFGSVSSYGGLAHQIDSAPRAVGGACGRNPLPILIPCHRVVAADGTLGGYSGFHGLDSKRFLLALEGWPGR